jgi:polyphosphate kinase 2
VSTDFLAPTGIDLAKLHGYTVIDVEDDDPVLVDREGRPVDTWRDGYPYETRMDVREYDLQKRLLQIELLKLQNWIKDSGGRLVIVFEGRDAAGKGGVIQRIVENTNPRIVRTVALGVPSDRERTQWYFQRYVQHLPAAGEIVLFDRSWYNRAGVERVMGFATEAEVAEFLRTAPEFERMLLRSGIQLVKYWFSVSDEEQERRFRARADDPTKRWKLSPMDLASWSKWQDYSRAKDEMFAATDTDDAPWWVVDGEVKRHARLNCIAHLLDTIPYEDTTPPPVELPPRPRGDDTYERPPMDHQRFVPARY